MEGRGGVGTPTVWMGVEPPSENSDSDEGTVGVANGHSPKLVPTGSLSFSKACLYSMLRVSYSELEGSGVEMGTKGGALAFSRDGNVGLGLTPRDWVTGVVGGFLGRFGEAPPRM